MPAVTAPVSPPDISAILTSLGVFSLAVAAVVSGIYKGIKEVKKGGSDTSKEVAGAVLLTSANITSLLDSNRRLCEVNHEMLEVVKALDRHAQQLEETLRLSREMTRSQIEEQHRLRAATVDLLDIMRRRT